jgi:uncharacterized membrane protein
MTWQSIPAGGLAESLVRGMGSAPFLFWQTLLVVGWIAVNVAFPRLRWDPYPLFLLMLLFSVQASYAAPLILLAQSRQAGRDRTALEEDRRRAAQAKHDTEYLIAEVAALLSALDSAVTRDAFRDELAEVRPQLAAAT